MNVLTVDDQRSARRILSDILHVMPDLVQHEAGSLEEARQQLSRHPIDVALIDIRLSTNIGNQDGLTLVSELRAHGSVIPIVVTAANEMGKIRAAMRVGAYDYILKDDLCDELVIPILQALRTRGKLEQEVRELRARCSPDTIPLGLIGASPAMQQLLHVIQRVALSDRPVLVHGPTGAGKELVVRAIHRLGAHPAEPLLDLNCGAIPDSLMESMLFGHERGSFTGADHKEGYLAAARQGTLFLDEIAELPLPLQAKLLRVLETGRFYSVGSTTEKKFAGRIVAATHADLRDRVKQRLFREDLYYRIEVLSVRVPALDERKDDIPALLSHFLKQQPRPLRFTTEAVDALTLSSWPGNVRQLRNLIDRVAVFCEEDLITPESLRRLGALDESALDGTLPALSRAILRLPIQNKLETMQDCLISEAVRASNGNKSAAARLLGVHRKAIDRRLERGEEEDGGAHADVPAGIEES